MVELTNPRANNFNILRLVAASSVIFSHAVDLAADHPDVFQQTIGYSGGWVAVSTFFSISGFLIYRSIIRSRSVYEYLLARCLRIFPGLWVMLTITTVILGLAMTSLPLGEYFSASKTHEYILGNAVLYVPKYFLPGVFESNPISAVNGSLWTLRFEFSSYILTLILFLIGAFGSERNFRIMTAAMLSGYFGIILAACLTDRLDTLLFDGSSFAKMHRLWFAFFVGILIGHYLDRFRPSLWVVVVAAILTAVSFGTPLFSSALIVFIALGVFWFAFLQRDWLIPFRNMEDYSYGIYIYAFPVQQVVKALLPEASWLTNSLISLALTVPLAALSWHFVEKPAMALKTRLIRGRKGKDGFI